MTCNNYIKPLKNKLVSVTSNPSTLVYFMSSMIQLQPGLIKLDSKNIFLFPCNYNIMITLREREREGEREREREREREPEDWALL